MMCEMRTWGREVRCSDAYDRVKSVWILCVRLSLPPELLLKEVWSLGRGIEWPTFWILVCNFQTVCSFVPA